MTVTPEQFRSTALALDGATEGSHMGHADFRVGGRIFATLGYPDAAWGVAILKPEDQQVRVEAEPEAFEPVPGGWGRSGSTRIRLAAVERQSLSSALAAAWRKAAEKPPRGR